MIFMGITALLRGRDQTMRITQPVTRRDKTTAQGYRRNSRTPQEPILISYVQHILIPFVMDSTTTTRH